MSSYSRLEEDQDPYFELRSYGVAEQNTTPINNLKWAFWTPGETRDVYTTVFVDRISDIDTKLHQATVSFTVYMKWKPSKQEYQELEKAIAGGTKEKFTPHWFPRWYVEDAALVHSKAPHPRERAQGWHVIKNKGMDIFGHTMILPNTTPCLFARCEKMVAVLGVNFDLDNFPFDVQDIPLVVMSSLPRGEMRVCPDVHKFTDNAVVNCAEIFTSLSPLENSWELHTPVVEYGSFVGELREVNVFSDSLTVRLKIARRSSLFVHRIGLVAMLLSSAVFAVFAVSEDFFSRLSDLLLLLVATTVYQWVWYPSLPATHAITLAEHYMRFTVLFIFLALGETAIVRTMLHHTNSQALRDTDIALCWGLFGVWCLVHLVFAYKCGHASSVEKKKITANKISMQKLISPQNQKVLTVPVDQAVVNSKEN